jgi:hypothetical protein
MLSDSERKQLVRLKQDLQEVRQLTTDMYGLGQAAGGSLLQGELTWAVRAGRTVCLCWCILSTQ